MTRTLDEAIQDAREWKQKTRELQELLREIRRWATCKCIDSESLATIRQLTNHLTDQD